METKQVIRVICTQEMACYAKPHSYLLKETYPLPPYSTVIGMVHAVCGFKTYHPMQVSIQGTFSPTVSDLYTRYSFSSDKFEADRHNLVIPGKGKEIGAVRGTAHVECVTDVRLVLHILPENEADLPLILEGFDCPEVFPALGRHNDLLNIESAELVTLTLSDEEVCATGRYADYISYVPIDLLEEITPYATPSKPATTYKLYKTYSIDPKTNRRIWDEVVRAKCLSNQIYFENVYVDTIDESADESCLVFLA